MRRGVILATIAVAAAAIVTSVAHQPVRLRGGPVAPSVSAVSPTHATGAGTPAAEAVIVALSPPPTLPPSAAAYSQMRRTLAAQVGDASQARQKVDSTLLRLSDEATLGEAQGTPGLHVSLPCDEKGRAAVEITATVNPAVLGEITALDGKVIADFPQYHSISAVIAPEKILELARSPAVTFIRPAALGDGQAAANTADPEGDIAHGADIARSRYHVDGRNVTVCVVADSIDDYSGLALSTAYFSEALDSRNRVTVLKDARGVPQTGAGRGEGVAMLEIIHRLAPAAKLVFATALPSEAAMATNIERLADPKIGGCRIIVDDYSYYSGSESPFQDGPVAQAIEKATARGVVYFTAAGNYGNVKKRSSSTWEGYFRDGGRVPGFAAARFHAFEPGINANVIGDPEPQGKDLVELFWNDPLGKASNQYELYVLSGNQIVGAGNDSVSKSGSPYQVVRMRDNEKHPRLQRGDVIWLIARLGAQPRFLHLDVRSAPLEYQTTGGITGHRTARDAITVGARSVPGTSTLFTPKEIGNVEAFSADGPRRIFYDRDGALVKSKLDYSSSGGEALQKPDFIAADNVTTTLPPSSLNPFRGTSAAAPHAAAIAALILCAHPSFNRGQVYAAMARSAIPLDGIGYSSTSGLGLVMAQTAVANAVMMTGAHK